MASYKAPTFGERAANAAAAKQKALERLKAKPPIDPAIAAERAAAREAKEAAAAERRAAKLQAIADAEAAKKAAAEAKAEAERLAAEEAEAARIAAAKPQLTEAERKALRDARYAARKKRK